MAVVSRDHQSNDLDGQRTDVPQFSEVWDIIGMAQHSKALVLPRHLSGIVHNTGSEDSSHLGPNALSEGSRANEVVTAQSDSESE